MTSPEIHEMLLDLAHTKRRLWEAEVRQGVIINFLRVALPKEDVELFDAYLKNEFSDDPVEIPREAKAMMAVLRALDDSFRNENEKRVEYLLEAKPCKEDPIDSIIGIQNQTKPTFLRSSGG